MGKKEIESGNWSFIPARVASEVSGEPLGISANFASTRINTGVESTQKNSYAENQRAEWQAERRKLRNESQKILFKTKKFSRLRSCGRSPLWSADGVEIRRNTESKSVYFAGLETCGNAWACPVCAPRIQYYRGEEIKKAVEKAYSEGLRVYMLTWTHPHRAGQKLKELNRAHNRARRYFKSGRWFQDWRDNHGYFGGVTASEVTWAQVNGWHWHSHELIFVKNKIDEHILKSRWINCLKKAGFDITDDNWADVYVHGLDVSVAHSSDYLTKMGLRGWGVDKELQGGGGKAGRDADGIRHYSPFELLEKGYEKEWIEYVEATRGLCQIQWTRGLKEWAQVEEKSDEQIAIELEADGQDVEGQEQEQKKEQEQKEQAEPDLLAIIPRSSWYKILGNEWREELLAVARDKGKGGIDAWATEKGLDIRVPGIINRAMQEFGGSYVDCDDIPA